MADKPIHPGEVLEEEFLKPLSLSRYKLAQAAKMSQTAIGEIVRGKRSITADSALRLGAALNMTPQFWMNLQSRYDLVKARARSRKTIGAIRPVEELAEV
jgi:addiction module HigA family antidote